MLFVISKILWLLVTPSTMLLVIGCAGLILQVRRHRTASIICLAVSLGAFAMIAVLPVSWLMTAPLEDRFPEVTVLPANVTGIIVLGGAIDTELSTARGVPSLNGAAARMTSLVYLARHYPDARLAFTGGNGALIHGPATEADFARTLFTQLGIDQRRIVYEDRSRTTYENAVLLKAVLKPRPGEQWLLVTSAWHMPRAIGLFRAAGWQVLAYPVGYKTAPDAWTDVHTSFPERLGMVDLATHEWIGLLAYWWLGHTSALLPAP